MLLQTRPTSTQHAKCRPLHPRPGRFLCSFTRARANPSVRAWTTHQRSTSRYCLQILECLLHLRYPTSLFGYTGKHSIGLVPGGRGGGRGGSRFRFYRFSSGVCSTCAVGFVSCPARWRRTIGREPLQHTALVSQIFTCVRKRIAQFL